MKEKLTQKECDLVVIGAGGAGLVAAIRAASLSKKKVVVLEKSAYPGGSGVYAGAIRIFGSKWQKDHNLPDGTQEFGLRAGESVYWRLNNKTIANLYRGTGQFFDWLCDIGNIPADRFQVGFYTFDGPQGPKIPSLIGYVTHRGLGYLIMTKMMELKDKYGVDVLTSHKVVDIETKNGRIAAVIADTPDGRVRFACKACILASGSWVSNKRIMKKVAPVFLETELARGFFEHHSPNLAGDGIALARKVGAEVDYSSFCVRPTGPFFTEMRSSAESIYAMVKSPCNIMVNLDGERFSCEPVQYRMGLFNGGYVLMQQPKGICYAIFEQNTLEATIRLKKAGDKVEAPPPPHTQTELASGTAFGSIRFPEPLSAVRANIAASLAGDDPEIFGADTIEVLARKIGIKPDALRRTITDYNTSCAAGMDWDFFKPAKYLVPLNRGPYYAVKGHLGSDGAFGGVPVNPDMQACKAGGGLVEGFYVVGDFAAAKHIVMSNVKVHVLNDSSFAFSSGFIAGASASKYLGSLK